MRFLIKMKLIVLIALWSLLCLMLFGVIALGEAVLEVGAGAAGSLVGQGGGLAGLMDLTGDIVQWVLGFIWLAGVLALWFVKKLLTSRATRAATAGFAVGAATKAAPFVLRKHPLGRAVNMANGPAGKMLAGMLARKARRR